jgi:predicted NUDIX family NTP pyrophosphohydrolase
LPKSSAGGLDRILQALGEIRQRGGKRVIAFCGEAEFDTASLSSNTFEIEWPQGRRPSRPRSGRRFPHDG